MHILISDCREVCFSISFTLDYPSFLTSYYYCYKNIISHYLFTRVILYYTCTLLRAFSFCFFLFCFFLFCTAMRSLFHHCGFRICNDSVLDSALLWGSGKQIGNSRECMEGRVCMVWQCSDGRMGLSHLQTLSKCGNPFFFQLPFFLKLLTLFFPPEFCSFSFFWYSLSSVHVLGRAWKGGKRSLLQWLLYYYSYFIQISHIWMCKRNGTMLFEPFWGFSALSSWLCRVGLGSHYSSLVISRGSRRKQNGGSGAATCCRNNNKKSEKKAGV